VGGLLSRRRLGGIGTEILDAKGRRVFANQAFGPLSDQTLTETFGERSEPACRRSLAEEPEEDVVTLDWLQRSVSNNPTRKRADRLIRKRLERTLF
jgi:hypothetical protein